MSKHITIVDYGIGNIFSVSRAFLNCGAVVEVTDNPKDIAKAKSIVLPGVGAFSKGMDGLRQRGLIDILRDFADTGRPMLGICLGMQMLFAESYEFGRHPGLGILEGKIVPIPNVNQLGKKLKIPHIGWAPLLSVEDDLNWNNTFFQNIETGDEAYFVHSFMAIPEAKNEQLAIANYDDVRICAAVAKGNILGCQFHPEKSGDVGLKIINNFLEFQNP